MRAAVHLAARDHIDPCDFLLEHGRLGGSQLRVREIPRRKLAERHQPIEGFVPTRHAMRADHGRRVFGIPRHDSEIARNSNHSPAVA